MFDLLSLWTGRCVKRIRNVLSIETCPLDKLRGELNSQRALFEGETGAVYSDKGTHREAILHHGGFLIYKQ